MDQLYTMHLVSVLVYLVSCTCLYLRLPAGRQVVNHGKDMVLYRGIR
jgi:hypothetical protein